FLFHSTHSLHLRYTLFPYTTLFRSWVNNVLSGQGVEQFANGTRYEGDFVDGKWQGSGKIHYGDGVVYEGSFFQSNRHGIGRLQRDRKSTRLNSSHVSISYAVFCLKK